MKYVIWMLLAAGPAWAGAAETLCAGNPAFARQVMLSIVQAQLQRDHDPALDADTPDKLADAAVAQGIAECAAEVRADPSIALAMAGLSGADLSEGWDAYNTACADRKVSKGACIQSEIGSAAALKHMLAAKSSLGVKTLMQTCQLVMQADPAMSEWRRCVDVALAAHASEAVAERCKVSVNYHVAKSGADAGQVIAACLSRG